MWKNIKYQGLMHLIILTWGFTGILGKLIHLEFYQIVFFRMSIAGISLLLILLVLKKSIRINNRKALIRTIGVGVLVLLHWLTFFKSIQVSTASVGVLCLATTSVHVSWLEPIIMKRKFSWIELFLGLLVIGGIAFITDKIDRSQIEGIAWGLVSGLFAALFSVSNARLRRDGTSSASITVYEMLTGAVILLGYLFFNQQINADFFTMTWSDFYWLLFLSIICTSLAFMLMIDVVDKIGAFSASLTINLEPVYSIFLAVIILGEDAILGANFYWGAVFIVCVVFLNPILKYYIAKRKKMIVRRI